MNVPIFRMELEGMRHTLHVALAEHTAKLDADLQDAITRFCTEENLLKIIDEQVKINMRAAVEAGVRDFFTYGKGNTTIKEQVAYHLEQQFK